ncbi:MAG: hypothetical protein AAGA92_14900 [Planctomycetota bacterium]
MNPNRPLSSLTAALLAGLLFVGGSSVPGAQGQETFDAPAEAADSAEQPARVEADAVPASELPTPELPVPDEKDEPAPSPVFPAATHLWGRFPVGSYRVLRTITETFNPDGSLLGKSVTTKHEVLKAVVDDTYVLDVKAAVDLDGKQVSGDWKTRALKLATDEPGRLIESADLGAATVEVHGEPFECRLWEFRYADENETVVQQTHYRRDGFPHAVRMSRTVLTEEEGGGPEATLSMEVTTMPVPYLLRGRIVSGCRTRWSRRSAKGRTVRSVFLCESVPGGAVEASSTDTDSEGRRVRHSVTELVDYGVAPIPDPTGKTSTGGPRDSGRGDTTGGQ